MGRYFLFPRGYIRQPNPMSTAPGDRTQIPTSSSSPPPQAEEGRFERFLRWLCLCSPESPAHPSSPSSDPERHPEPHQALERDLGTEPSVPAFGESSEDSAKVGEVYQENETSNLQGDHSYLLNETNKQESVEGEGSSTRIHATSSSPSIPIQQSYQVSGAQNNSSSSNSHPCFSMSLSEWLQQPRVLVQDQELHQASGRALGTEPSVQVFNESTEDGTKMKDAYHENETSNLQADSSNQLNETNNQESGILSQPSGSTDSSSESEFSTCGSHLSSEPDLSTFEDSMDPRHFTNSGGAEGSGPT